MLKNFLSILLAIGMIQMAHGQLILEQYVDLELNSCKKKSASMIQRISITPEGHYKEELIHLKTNRPMVIRHFQEKDLKVLHGPYAMYRPVYSSNKKGNEDQPYLIKGFYKDGLKDSTWVEYAPYSGKKIKLMHYSRDTLDGNYKEWKNEEITISGQYIMGKKHGVWEKYGLDREVKESGTWDKGVKDGQWIFSNGVYKKEGFYKQGSRDGDWVAYYKNDQIRRKWSYREGQLDGVFQSWYENGVLCDSGRYESNEKIGEWRHYFDSGEKSGYAMYREGKMDSIRYWNEAGQLISGDEITFIEPAFKGGPMAMMEFINNHVDYPQEAIEKAIQGTVYVQFDVGWDGDIIQAKVLKSPDDLLSEEAIRIVNQMPLWVPGQYHTIVQKVKFTLPIAFRLG